MSEKLKYINDDAEIGIVDFSDDIPSKSEVEHIEGICGFKIFDSNCGIRIMLNDNVEKFVIDCNGKNINIRDYMLIMRMTCNDNYYCRYAPITTFDLTTLDEDNFYKYVEKGQIIIGKADWRIYDTIRIGKYNLNFVEYTRIKYDKGMIKSSNRHLDEVKINDVVDFLSSEDIKGVVDKYFSHYRVVISFVGDFKLI